MSELLSNHSANTSGMQMLKKRFRQNAFLLGLCFGTLVAASGLMFQHHQAEHQYNVITEDASQLEQTLRYIENEYVDKIDSERLQAAAIRGIMQELDTHSSYLDTEAYQELVTETDGAYAGVGIEIETIDERVYIISPIDGSPAALAGLRAGDEIIAINGTSIQTLSHSQLLAMARGYVGTTLTLSIHRSHPSLKPAKRTEDELSRIDDTTELLEVSLIRDIIPMQSVSSAHLANGVAYFRLSHFTDRSADDLHKAIRTWQAKTDPMQGIIFDLRNNPGGLVTAAVDVADLFLESGTIVSAEGRTPEANFKHLATTGDVTNGLPVVIMINHATASSAEIVAGALKDRKRAIIVGHQSFGKGSVQSVIPMLEGDALKLTTSYYYTPLGYSLHGRGVEPDITVEEAEMMVTIDDLHAFDTHQGSKTAERELYLMLTALTIKDPTLLKAWQYIDDTQTGRAQIAMEKKKLQPFSSIKQITP